jgi:hypothetical protein
VEQRHGDAAAVALEPAERREGDTADDLVEAARQPAETLAEVEIADASHATGEAADATATTDLGDGQSGDFTSVPGRLEVEAVITPTNTFSLAAITRNKKTGTATLAFDLPNPGELGGAAKGAKISPVGPGGTGSVTAPGNGPSQLLVRAKGKKNNKLNQKGKVKLNVAATYTPTGGDPSTQSIKVMLKKKT